MFSKALLQAVEGRTDEGSLQPLMKELLEMFQNEISCSLSVYQHTEEIQSDLLLAITISHICLINPYGSYKSHSSYITCARPHIEASLILPTYKKLYTYEIHTVLNLAMP